MSTPPRHAPTARRGLSVIESAITVVIVATLIVMALNAFGSVARGQKLTADRYRAAGLARQLMTEILQRPWEDPDGSPVFGPEAEQLTGRSAWDDVDDYNDYAESPLTTADGTALAGCDGWRRAVVVESISAGLKQVTVTVATPQGAQASAGALRASNGAVDETLGSAGDYLGWVGVEIQVGDGDAGRAFSGTDIACPVRLGD